MNDFLKKNKKLYGSNYVKKHFMKINITCIQIL